MFWPWCVLQTSCCSTRSVFAFSCHLATFLGLPCVLINDPIGHALQIAIPNILHSSIKDLSYPLKRSMVNLVHNSISKNDEFLKKNQSRRDEYVKLCDATVSCISHQADPQIIPPKRFVNCLQKHTRQLWVSPYVRGQTELKELCCLSCFSTRWQVSGVTV